MARIREKTLKFPGLNNTYTFADEADLFDANVDCAVGEYRIYDGDLYRCTTAHTGAWAAADFKKVKLGDEIAALNNAVVNGFDERTIPSTASGNLINIKDSMGARLKALSADGDCSVFIKGKNFLSADFPKDTYANRAEGKICIGKGAYDYSFPSRINVSKCAGNEIKFTVTASQVLTTGVGMFVAVKPGTKYVLSYEVSGPGTVSFSNYDDDKTYIANGKESAQSGYSYTVPENIYYHYVAFRATAQNQEVTFKNFQLEVGEAATDFTMYQPTQIASLVADTPADVSNLYSNYPVTNLFSFSDVEIEVEYASNDKKYIDNQNEELRADLIADIQKNAFVSSYNILDGWEPHAKAFSELMEDVTDTEGFMFFTDTHFMAKQTESAWKEYAYAIFAYLEQLYYASPCSFVLHGGDWLGSGEAWDSIIYKLSTLGGIFRSRFDRFALLVGNHETGNQSSGNHTTTHGTLAATLLSNVGKTYYRFDANTFHMYCFDSWVSGAIDAYAEEQIAWFANSLEEETADHIVIAIHILYDSDVLKGLGDELTKCADAYNNGSTYTYDGATYDFTNATGKVGFIIAGHEHSDETGTVNDIPYILTTNTTGYSETTFSNLPLPIDLIKVDWDSATLTAYRAARGAEGTTRTLSIIA